MRRVALVLLPIGPLCVGLLRFLLPYYTADGDLATARAVLAHPDRESAVLWLGLAAVITLVPGVITIAGLLPRSSLKAWALALCIPGYLCLGALLAEDDLLWSGAHAKADPHQLADLLAAMHPSIDVATAIFVVGHVLGTVLLGIALLRSRVIPSWACWFITVSQPLHFAATVIFGSPTLDLLAWTMTAIGMGAAAHVLLIAPDLQPTPSPHPIHKPVKTNRPTARPNRAGASSRTTPRSTP